MSQDLVARKQNPLLTAELAELGREALEAHERVGKCAAEAVENMVRAGQFLCKARDLCEAHAFEQFIVNHFRGKRRTAQTYMKLARNWHLLEAAAPPDRLTSQRKALRLLDRLLADQQSPSEEPPRRRKRRRPTAAAVAPSTNTGAVLLSQGAASGKAAVDLAPPAITGAVAGLKGSLLATPAAPANTASGEREVAVRAMYQATMRLLAELRKEFLQVTPQHYAVEYALHLIARTRSEFEQTGHKLFDVGAATSGATARMLSERSAAPTERRGNP